VSATGGEPELLARVKDDEVALEPQFLPGGNALLFTEAGGVGTRLRPEDDNNAIWDKARIVVQSLRTGERKTLIEGGSDGRYVPTGHIVYAVGGTLRAAAFDLRRLATSGRAAPVVEGVARTKFATLPTGSAHVAVSGTGTLVYLPGAASISTPTPRDVAFFSRNGGTEPLKLPPMEYEYPTVSPDGKQLAVSTDDGKNAQVWIYDLAGAGQPRQLTFQGRNRYPIWSPDGRRVAFQSDRDGNLAIYWQAADGRSPAERLTTSEPRAAHTPQSWSPNGAWLLYTVEAPSGFSLWALSVHDKNAQPFGAVRSATVVNAAAFSPDGKWVAYQSGEVPNPQIFVQPFPSTGALYQAALGRHPRWSPDGTELFFTQQNRVLTVAVTTQPTIRFGNPAPVLPLGAGGATVTMQTNYDLTRDGGRFIAPVTAGGFEPVTTISIRRIEIVLNWFQELKQLVPTE
jgi:roadblock/LC7 domain-containing protein